jgi:cyclopropane fatty-acyl-phospholipid synthase-like methyltransferase
MLLTSVRNWLSGPPPDADAAPLAAVPALEAVAQPISVPSVLWSEARIALAGRLWGDGYVLPGGEEEVLRLARPLGLSGAASLLVLGCGPGGAVCSIAGQLGVWVSGFETDPELADAGAVLCTRSGLGARAKIQQWHPERPEFQPRCYHHALGLEPMRAAPPETVLASVVLALRPGGQLALLEVVSAEKPGRTEGDLARWMELEGRQTPPVDEAAITRALGRLGFEIRVTEDVSERHAAQVVQGWQAIVQALQCHRPEAAAAALLVRDGELWLLRARLLRAGRLRLVRWHAIGRSGRG